MQGVYLVSRLGERQWGGGMNKKLTPANFFVEQWIEASGWRSSLLTSAVPPDEQFLKCVRQALKEHDGSDAYSKLKDLIDTDLGYRRNGRILAILSEIDKFFLAIHPRSYMDSSTIQSRLGAYHWLKQLQLVRLVRGEYFRTDQLRLIPRGPLTRLHRPEDATSAHCFSDRFAALAVVPDNVMLEDIRVPILHLVKGGGAADGIIGSVGYKDRTVAFVPVAEDKSHLQAIQRSTNQQHFVDYSTASSINVPQALDAILKAIGFADIVLAPEMVVSEVDAASVKTNITNRPGEFRFFLAGTGCTQDSENGQPWNEARVFNGAGATIFKQRKLWQAEIRPQRVEDFGLQPCEGRIMEDNASGEELSVADLDGFGRCLILICQDLQARPLVESIIQKFQPDWIFVPILDMGISEGRWTHQRSFELSGLSPARFLVVSSLALASKSGLKDAACGMAVGPKDGDEEITPRKICLAKIDSSKAEGYALISWADAWGETRLKVV